jgi:flagellar motor switch protein FliM
MLHDPEAAVSQEGEFSALEETILMDVATILFTPLDDVLAEQIKLKVQPSGQPVRGDWVMRTRILEDLCELSFTARFGEKEIVFSLILESVLLDSYVGIKTPTVTSSALSSVRILERLRGAPVSVCAHISTEMIGLGDLAQLEPGDVLVLNKKVNTPLQVLLNGRGCFQAYPAEQKGKLSLVITEPGSEYE